MDVFRVLKNIPRRAGIKLREAGLHPSQLAAQLGMRGIELAFLAGKLGLLGQEPLLLPKDARLLSPESGQLVAVRVGGFELGDGAVDLGQAGLGLSETTRHLGQSAVDLCQQTVHLANAAFHQIDRWLQLAEDVAPRDRADQRQPAVVVDKVKTKLRVVEPFGKVACCDTKLPTVAGPVVLAARDPRRTHRQERRIRGTRRLGRIEPRIRDRRHPCRLTLEQAVERIVHVTLHVRLAGAAEAQHRILPARPNKILRAEITSRWVDLHLLLLELVKAFQRQGVRHLQRHRQQRHRPQRLAQLRARDAELGHVNRVDDIDAVLDKRTLAPTQHLVAQTDIYRNRRREIV